MDSDKTDLIIQYALAVAAESEEFKERELGPIHLIKLVYLADLAYARENQGETFSGAPWRFHHFGPWSPEVFNRIEPAARAVGGSERRFPSQYKEEEAVRWRVQDRSLTDRLEPRLPGLVASAVKRGVRTYGTDTTSLLRDVYSTPPMLQAAPGESLDFKLAMRPAEFLSESATAAPAEALPRLSKTKVRNLKAFVQRRLEEKKQAKLLTPPDPAPRYDEVFEKGQEWLDTLSGEPLQAERGRLRFADSVWKSPARRDPGTP
jgi:hypothetical protein